MDDAAFRKQFKPVHVPSSIVEAKNSQDKVVYALAEINEGTADAVSRKLEELDPGIPDKLVIAEVHRTLTELYSKGLIAGNEIDGGIVFNLHKITKANEGKVNPEYLAPGLD